MSDNFDRLKIVSLDKDATKPSGSGGLQSVVLRLSAYASVHWVTYFNDAWERHLYMMKRHAYASGNSITITCMPDELQMHHINELNKVITKTNNAYEQFLTEQLAQKAVYDEKERARKAQLDKLGQSLKFD